MRAKRYIAALFVLMLAPSAYMAWTWRDMPHLGLHHDDTLYLVGAKSLAEGHGYRIESLPGQPFQTKYPPLLPWLLSALWKFGPVFPQNLPMLTLFAWLMLPATLWLMRVLFQRFGFGPVETWVLTLAAAVHPLILLLGVTVLSDLLFLTLFLACLLLAERALDGARSLALAAGAVGGITYLARTAALPLVIAVPLCFLFRRQLGKALLFAAGMLPAIINWQVWVSAHAPRTSDPILMFYTSYLGMQRATVHLDNLPLVVWHNLDALLCGSCRLIIFDSVPMNPHLQQMIGVAAIAGAVRLVKRTRQVAYPAAAAGFVVLLLVYFFPSDPRILLPVYPLVLMGFWTEVKNLGTVVRLAWIRGRATERVLAAVMTTAVAALGGLMVAGYVTGDLDYLPKFRAAGQAERLRLQPACDWIRGHTAPTATVYAYLDPLLYLYTGRHALGLPSWPARLYEEKAVDRAKEFPLSILRQAREHHVDYFLITTVDGYMEGLKGRVWEAAERDRKLRKEFGTAEAAVYSDAAGDK
jgi:hypothetical protein